MVHDVLGDHVEGDAENEGEFPIYHRSRAGDEEGVHGIEVPIASLALVGAF